VQGDAMRCNAMHTLTLHGSGSTVQHSAAQRSALQHATATSRQ
jgi:hypothetical protein